MRWGKGKVINVLYHNPLNDVLILYNAQILILGMTFVELLFILFHWVLPKGLQS